jgi:hypothetical protein
MGMSDYRLPTSKKQTYDKAYGQVNIVQIKGDKVHAYWRDVDFDGKVLLDADKKPLEPKELPTLKVENCLPVCKVGKWMATLSGDRLYNLRPISGVFPGHFKEFIASKDAAPSPKMTKGQYPHLVFGPLFELDREDVQGMVVGYRYPGLRFNFEPFEREDGKSIVGYSVFDISKSPATMQLDEFMRVTGITDFGDMPWTDNPLPMFQKRALKANKSILIHVENGSIKSLIPDQSSAFSETEETE